MIDRIALGSVLAAALRPPLDQAHARVQAGFTGQRAEEAVHADEVTEALAAADGEGFVLAPADLRELSAVLGGDHHRSKVAEHVVEGFGSVLRRHRLEPDQAHLAEPAEPIRAVVSLSKKRSQICLVVRTRCSWIIRRMS